MRLINKQTLLFNDFKLIFCLISVRFEFYQLMKTTIQQNYF